MVEAVGVNSALNSIVESTARGCNAKGCSILTLLPGKERLQHRITYGLSSEYIAKGDLVVDQAIEEVLSGKPVVIHDAANDLRIQYPEYLADEGIASMLSIPIRGISGDISGMLRVYDSKPRKYKKGEIDFLVSIADLGGIVLEKAEEHDLLVSDVDEAKLKIRKLEEDRTAFLEFLSMVSHDLKSPIAAVESYVKVMLRGSPGPLTAKQKRWLERSVLRLDGMLELISDLLDISRLETGRIEPEMSMLSLDEVFCSCKESANSILSSRNIRLAVDTERGFPEIYASMNRLKQVVNNLIANASRYTPEGGHIQIKSDINGNRVVVSVEDDGKGISEENLPKIFDDFFRGNHDTEGTGLGLSICKRIIALHGGEIWAESPVPETGKGTRISFSLPIKKKVKVRVLEGQGYESWNQP